MIDNHDVAARRRDVGGLSGTVLRHISPDAHHGSVAGCENFFAVGIIVGIASSIPLVAFTVRSDLQEIVGERFRQESLVRIQVAMLGCDVPRSFERQSPGETWRSLKLSRRLLRFALAS